MKKNIRLNYVILIFLFVSITNFIMGSSPKKQPSHNEAPNYLIAIYDKGKIVREIQDSLKDGFNSMKVIISNQILHNGKNPFFPQRDTSKYKRHYIRSIIIYNDGGLVDNEIDTTFFKSMEISNNRTFRIPKFRSVLV